MYEVSLASIVDFTNEISCLLERAVEATCARFAHLCRQSEKSQELANSLGVQGGARSLYYLFSQNRLPEAPKIGQHVRIEGQPGVYVVLRLDTKRFAADLMLTTAKHEIEENAPYFAIELIDDKEMAQKPTTQESRSGTV